MIELDHIDLYCRGGEHSASNLQLKCRLHNHFAAAAAFGNEWYRHKRTSEIHRAQPEQPSSAAFFEY